MHKVKHIRANRKFDIYRTCGSYGGSCMVNYKPLVILRIILELIEIPILICGVIMALVFGITESYELLDVLYKVGFIVLLSHLGLTIIVSRIHNTLINKIIENIEE